MPKNDACKSSKLVGEATLLSYTTDKATKLLSLALGVKITMVAKQWKVTISR
jgi:hypothetical protein